MVNLPAVRFRRRRTAPSHPRLGQGVFVLEGLLEVLTGDRVQTLPRGDFVFVPGGTAHNFQMKAPGTRFLSVNSRAPSATKDMARST